jgi:uncharacterized membrane protein YfhO
VRDGAGAVVAARDYRLTPNTTTFVVDASGPGLVVLGETFWPGVTATVDGRAVEVVRVNDVMRGVFVDGPGTLTVRFAYRPRGAGTSALLAVAGVALLGGMVFVGRQAAS